MTGSQGEILSETFQVASVKEVLVALAVCGTRLRLEIGDGAASEAAFSAGGLGCPQRCADVTAMLAHDRHITALAIDLLQPIGAEVLAALVRALEHNRTVQELQLRLWNNMPELYEVCTAFRDALAFNHTLETLICEVVGPGKSGMAIAGLATAAATSSSLKALRVEASFTTTVDADMAVLANGVSSCTSLEELSVSLTGTSVGDAGFAALADALRRRGTLQSLTLRVPQTNVGAIGMKALADALTDMTALRSLHLWLSAAPGLNDGFVELASALSRQPKLENLVLRARESPLEPASVEALAVALRVVPALRYLRLELPSAATQGAALERLAESLDQPRSLASFDLSVSAPGSPEASSRELARVLGHLPGLRHIRGSKVPGLDPAAARRLLAKSAELEAAGRALVAVARLDAGFAGPSSRAFWRHVFGFLKPAECRLVPQAFLRTQ